MSEPIRESAAVAAPPAAPLAGHEEKARPVRTRRVGTLTCGIALIIFGIVVGAFLIWPNFDLMLLLRLCPALLILLGGELIAASFSRFELRLKYDFASIFLCLVLGLAAVGLSIFLVVVRWFGPDQQAVQARLTAQTDAAAYQLLEDEPAVEDCRSDVVFYTPVSSQTDIATINPDHLRFEVTLRGPYTDAGVFAADCARIRDLLMAGNVSPDRITFTWTQEDGAGFYLMLDGLFALKEDGSLLSERVEAI